jgi:hypothetical protein
METPVIKVGNFELSREEILDRCAKQVLDAMGYDDEGDPESAIDSISRTVRRTVNETQEKVLTAAVERITREVLEPTYERVVRETLIQHTSTYGEKKGEPETLTEFISKKIEAYLAEEVNDEGFTYYQMRNSGRSYNRSGDRITVAVRRAVGSRI